MANKDKGAFKYINYGVSFGLTMAITIYLLYLGGSWLDRKFDTEPLFMVLGILLGVGAVFKRMFTEIKTMNKSENIDDEDR